VLERAGFRREGVLRHNFMPGGAWMDDVLFGLLEADLRQSL
jgi:aminoglycoside 6'-N-acetyltransferase